MRWQLHQLPPTVRKAVIARHPDLAGLSGSSQRMTVTGAKSPGQDRLTQALQAVFGARVQAEYVPLPDRHYRMDVAVPDARLAIEINGWSNHGKSLRSFQSDHERTRALLLAGWRVVPFTHREAMQETGRCGRSCDNWWSDKSRKTLRHQGVREFDTARRIIMALNLQQGGQMEPVRMVLYGQNGIGKTTFGAGMNRPFILAVEDGIGTMPVWHDKAHAKNYDEIIQTLMDVGGYFQKGEFQSLIVDSMDALQGKIQEKILREHGKKTLNDFSYGKGYELFKQEWEGFRNLMERFRVELRANVLLIAQTESKTVADPVNGPHDTYVMRLDKRAVGVLRDWADLVGFAQLKADPVRDKDGNIVRLVTNGTRILCTAPNTAFDAKNRFDLPLELPLAWNSVEKAIQDAYQRPFDPHRFAQASISGFGAPIPPQGAAPPQGAGTLQGTSGQPTPGFGLPQPQSSAPLQPQPVAISPSPSAGTPSAGAPSAWPAAQRPAFVPPPRKPTGPGM